jgi:hypothetical protein
MEWNMSSLWWRRARPCSATPPELRGADPCCGFSVLVSRELYACARTGYTQRKWNGMALHWLRTGRARANCIGDEMFSLSTAVKTGEDRSMSYELLLGFAQFPPKVWQCPRFY